MRPEVIPHRRNSMLVYTLQKVDEEKARLGYVEQIRQDADGSR